MGGRFSSPRSRLPAVDLQTELLRGAARGDEAELLAGDTSHLQLRDEGVNDFTGRVCSACAIAVS